MNPSKVNQKLQWKMTCIDCQAEFFGLSARTRCDCGGTLDIVHDFSYLQNRFDVDLFSQRRLSDQAYDRSGVWRFRELVLPLEPKYIVTKPEGNTNTYTSQKVAEYVGLEGLWLKHEGENPTGSFKDRGMTVGVSLAHRLGADRVACASTGNTSASMASYAAQAGMRAYVFIPEGNIAFGKLSQALAHGAKTIQIAGDFDDAMTLVEQLCMQEGIYLLNSVNPFRIEGQKAILFELLQDLSWRIPDWIVLPGGNLGNNTAISKGLLELYALGLIKTLPRLAVIQAQGANPLYTAYITGKYLEPVRQPQTLATAIKIGNPVSWKKSLRGIRALKGIVEQVTDQEIMDAKARVDEAGIGAEPASSATVAGIKKLITKGVIRKREMVCGILTGHVLKDPDAVVNYHTGKLKSIASRYANQPVSVSADLQSVLRAIRTED